MFNECNLNPIVPVQTLEFIDRACFGSIDSIMAIPFNPYARTHRVADIFASWSLFNTN